MSHKKGWIHSIKKIFQKDPQKSNEQPKKTNLNLTPTLPENNQIKSPQKQYEQDFAEQTIRVIEQEPDIEDQRYQKLQSQYTPQELELERPGYPGEIVLFHDRLHVEYKIQKETYIKGEFVLTNFKYQFIPKGYEGQERKDYFVVPLGNIDRIEKRHQNNKIKDVPLKLVISLKDTRSMKFKITSTQSQKKITELMQAFTFCKQKKYFFAFRYFQFNSDLQNSNQGWRIYNALRQYKRMRIPIHQLTDDDIYYNFKFIDNNDGKICTTYPSLLAVPSRMNNQDLLKCAKFRSRERLPCMTYAHQYALNKFSTLFRCSQNRVGMGMARCTEDELMLRMIGNPNADIKQTKQVSNCNIYDARGYMAAVGNMFGGKGFERSQFYKNCEIQWLNIPNIHAVRQSYHKMKLAALEYDDTKYLVELAESSWYDCIFLILSGAKSIARSLLNGTSCVVHCSDGWDRTSQLCALSQLLIDPYYRTMEGFAVLIEKDFVSFGHKFCERLGQGNSNYADQQRSPVFLQFLDCVTQIMHQFPLSFQFNLAYVNQILKQSSQHTFGNFLCDNQLQQTRTHIFTRTVSLWSYLLQHKNKYLNPYYQKDCLLYLDISTALKNVRIWKEHFFYYCPGNADAYNLFECDWSDQNLETIHRQVKQQKESLLIKYKQNNQIIEQMQLRLQSLRNS